MATHSSVLAWRIPGTGEPGRLLSLGSHRVGHDCSDLAAAAATDIATVHGIAKSRTQLNDFTHLTDIASGHSFCPLLMSVSEAFPISTIL